MKTKLFSLALLLTAVVGFAQQDAQFTIHATTNIPLMPDQEVFEFCITSHTMGWFRRCSSYKCGFNKHAFNNSRLGLGVSIVNDKIGPTNENIFLLFILHYSPEQ
jgi:hypothetical protein